MYYNVPMTPQERANDRASYEYIKRMKDAGKPYFGSDDDLKREFPEFYGPNAGALVPGGGVGKQSINIEMHNDFQVSGFSPEDVGREVLRGMGRSNADLVRNLGPREG